ncbi:MAG: 1-acyl-sn-glycerol-3-phosphate acyltransferase [Candidatus Adiutrix sp.]|nr:1-acyl-sn-glycerol-3-phosphate acyltransferase [Candidatus Adiutrix sp.]
MTRLAAANIWCWGWLAVLSAAALMAAPLWLLLGLVRGRGLTRGAREGIWLYGRAYLFLIRPFVKVRLREGEAAEAGPASIIVMNHQSWLDIYVLGLVREAREACFLVRAWPFRRLFFFRPLMRLAGYIETEGVEAEAVFIRCRSELRSGSCLVCFPEGARSPDGRLGRFHSGVFKLAVEAGRAVRPLAVFGSGQVMPKGSLIFRPGAIEIKELPPAAPARFAGEAIVHGAMRRFVRLRFIRALEKPETNEGACSCQEKK